MRGTGLDCGFKDFIVSATVHCTHIVLSSTTRWQQLVMLDSARSTIVVAKRATMGVRLDLRFF